MGRRREERKADVAALRELENEATYQFRAGLVKDLEESSAQELGLLAMKEVALGDMQEWVGKATRNYSKAAALSNLAILKTLTESPAPIPTETQA